ncbi:MAG: 50S ribosomal protein L4 [Candidatus Diapherotrites archaeon]
MKGIVYSLQGVKEKEISLPEVFDTEVDENLIKRAVLSMQSNARTPYGAMPRAGRNTVVQYVGARHFPMPLRTINTGRARKPRTKNRRFLLYGQVKGIPGTVKGPKAHSPESWKVLGEKINLKEKRKALQSAIAATGQIEFVQKRGHSFGEIKLPLIVSNELENVKKTKEVLNVLKLLKVGKDVERAKDKKKVRAGRGKSRGRKHKRAKSVLIVISDAAKNLQKAARNLEGVDVCRASQLNAELLAPGAVPGRLTVYTENSLKELPNGERA